MMLKTAVEDKDTEELVQLWRDEGHDEAYDELRDRHEGLVYNQTNRYRASPVPQKAIETEAWKHFDDAVENYDPSKDAKFSTYLTHRLKRLDRYNKNRQNFARIPEERARKISDFENAKERLQDKHGRQPDHEEIADEAGLDPDETERIARENRQDLYEGQYEGEQYASDEGERGNQILEDIRDDLEDHEQEVYDHLVGYGDTEKVDDKKEVAEKKGVSPGRISQITSGIADKVQDHAHKF